MKVQKTFLLILFLSLLNVNVTFGQQYAFSEIGLSEGLPTTEVNALLQDTRGFYWLATEGAGLVRYDGYEFVPLTRDLPKPYLFIYSLAQDASGNLWMGVENGVVRYDGQTFTEMLSPEQNSPTQSIVFFKDTILTTTRNGELFYSTASDTLLPYSNSLKATAIAKLDNKLVAGSATGLLFGSRKILDAVINKVETFNTSVFAATDSGLYKFSASGVAQELLLKDKNISTFAVKEGLIAATNGNELYLISNAGVKIIGTKNGLPLQNYLALYFDNYGTLWAIGDRSLVQLGSPKSVFWTTPNKVNLSAAGYFKNTAYAASSNQLWQVSTQGDTLLPLPSPSFGTVQSIKTYQNNLYLATERGLFCYNGQAFKRIPLRGLYSNVIFSLETTENGLYIGTGQGLYRLTDDAIYNEQVLENLPASTVYAISAAADGSVWCATYFDGFYRLSKGKWTLRADRELNLKVDSLQINTFVAESVTTLWVATATQGLVRINASGKTQLKSNRLNFADITTLRFKKNILWAGSSKGVFEIYEDKLHRNDYFIKQLGLAQGMLGKQINAGALVLKDSLLFAGTNEGLQKIVLPKVGQQKLHLQLTEVELFFGDVKNLNDFASTQLPFSELPAGLKLPYNLNFINFKLSGLQPLYGKQLQYRYRLRKRDVGEWTNAGTRREAIFSNLKPNDYTFEAQTSVDGITWSSPLLSYSFSIKPPYYLTWWFISLLVLATAGLVYVFVNERVKRTNQKLLLENRLINMERKALRLQMNPHFIFNALDSISSFIFKKDPKMAVRYLNNFAKLMRLTLESSMEHLHPVETEVSILKNYLELEQLRFQRKFEYEIELDDEIDYDIGIPPMLIQPHVENAILHGIKPKVANGNITIRFILEDDFLICEIEDDGIGRAAAKEIGNRKAHRSMATQINKDRIRLLKDAMNDAIAIDIIDKFDKEKVAAGTLVRIRLLAESI